MTNEYYSMRSGRELSDGDLALELETMANVLEDHPAYKGQVIPGWIPDPPALRRHASLVKSASAAAKQDSQKAKERDQVRESGIEAMLFSKQYVVMYSSHHKVPSPLEGIGLKEIHRGYNKHHVVNVPARTSKFKVVHGKESGSINAYVNRWEGKGRVELQICEGDPSVEEAWRTLRVSHVCKIAIEGLEPARRCHFRARYQNDAGNGPWSEVQELIIL